MPLLSQQSIVSSAGVGIQLHDSSIEPCDQLIIGTIIGYLLSFWTITIGIRVAQLTIRADGRVMKPRQPPSPPHLVNSNPHECLRDIYLFETSQSWPPPPNAISVVSKQAKLIRTAPYQLPGARAKGFIVIFIVVDAYLRRRASRDTSWPTELANN
jgi:hypothetical protein